MSSVPRSGAGTSSAMSDGRLEGMVLAATIADDRDGSKAAPGLAPGLARAFGARIEALSRLDAEARREEVRRLAGRLLAVDPGAVLPPRAGAILAGSLPRELGRKWAGQAPPVRRGFRIDAALKATLRRLAGPTDPGAHRAEIDAAADAGPRLRAWAERIAGGDDVQRVLGALALGAAGDTTGDTRSTSWRRIGAELKLGWESPWRR